MSQDPFAMYTVLMVLLVALIGYLVTFLTVLSLKEYHENKQLREESYLDLVESQNTFELPIVRPDPRRTSKVRAAVTRQVLASQRRRHA